MKKNNDNFETGHSLESFDIFDDDHIHSTDLYDYEENYTFKNVDPRSFLPENRVPGNDQFDFTQYIVDLTKRYNKIKEFKKVVRLPAQSEILKTFSDYAIKNPEEAFDVVLHENNFINNTLKIQDEDHPIFSSNPSYSGKSGLFYCYTIINKDFILTYRRNKFNFQFCMLLFFNDEKFIKEKFFNRDFKKKAYGIYELGTNSKNEYILKDVKLEYIEEPILDEEIIFRLKRDMDCFFDNKEFYRKNNLPFKRGLLFYGGAGNGKTTTLKHFLASQKDSYRLFVDCGKYFSGTLFDFMMEVFPRSGKKIIVFEDVDSVSAEGYRSHSKRSEFLNFIDGAKNIDSCLFIATTNYPDLVDPALINRPSRFDRIYRIDYPSDKCRRVFILKFFPELKDKEEELKEYIKLTDGFSGAYFKELFIMVNIQKSTIKESIKQLKEQIDTCKKQKFSKEEKKIGFGHDLF